MIFDLFRIGERGEIVTTEGGPLSELDPSTSYIDSVRSINVQSSVAFFFEEGYNDGNIRCSEALILNILWPEMLLRGDPVLFFCWAGVVIERTQLLSC